MGKDQKHVQLNISIPIQYRDQLRKMAAEINLENPGQVLSSSSIAAAVLISALIGKENKEATRNEHNQE